MPLETKMRSSALMAKLSRPAPTRPTTSASPESLRPRAPPRRHPRRASAAGPERSNLTANGAWKPDATVSTVPRSTSTRTTSLKRGRGPYSLSSGPQSMPFSPHPGPSWSLIRRGSSMPSGSISKSWSPRAHCDTKSRPSSENVIGFTPRPGEATTVVVPSGVRFPTSPMAKSVQNIEPSGPNVRSSGPFTPSSGPQRSRTAPLSGSTAATAALDKLAT